MLYDSFAQPEADKRTSRVIDNPRARHVVVYTWNFHPELVDGRSMAGRQRLPVQDAPGAASSCRHRSDPRGKVVISDPPRPRVEPAVGLDWPGRTEGLTDREAEILALITQGVSNPEIAQVTYLSMNTVKTYIRSAYRKIGVTSRTQAVLWGPPRVPPDHHRIDHWRGGP